MLTPSTTFPSASLSNHAEGKLPILVFFFADKRGDAWLWAIRHEGRVVAKSDRTFHYYLDALTDARAHGHNSEPHFAMLADDGTYHQPLVVRPVISTAAITR